MANNMGEGGREIGRWLFLCQGTTAPSGPGTPVVEATRSHSDTPHSVGLRRTSDQPDAETSYLTTHNTHNRQTSMSAAGFEPAIPTNERPQNHALDRAATGIIKGIGNFNIRRCQVGKMGKVLLNRPLTKYVRFMKQTGF